MTSERYNPQPAHVDWSTNTRDALAAGKLAEHPLVKSGLYSDDALRPTMWTVKARAVLNTYMDQLMLACCELAYRFARPTRPTQTIEPHGLVDFWPALGVRWSHDDERSTVFVRAMNECIIKRAGEGHSIPKDCPVCIRRIRYYLASLRDETILLGSQSKNTIAAFLECICLDIFFHAQPLLQRKGLVGVSSLIRASSVCCAQAVLSLGDYAPAKWLSDDAL